MSIGLATMTELYSLSVARLPNGIPPFEGHILIAIRSHFFVEEGNLVSKLVANVSELLAQVLHWLLLGLQELNQLTLLETTPVPGALRTTW